MHKLIAVVLTAIIIFTTGVFAGVYYSSVSESKIKNCILLLNKTLLVGGEILLGLFVLVVIFALIYGISVNEPEEDISC